LLLEEYDINLQFLEEKIGQDFEEELLVIVESIK